MNKYLYPSISLAFLLGDLLFNSFSFGPFPVRIYIAMATLVFVVFKKAKVAVPKDIYLYAGFVMFFLFSTLMTGKYHEENILKIILARYVVSFIAAYSFSLFARNLRLVDIIVFILVGIGIVNGLVSVAQFLGIPEGMQITEFLNPSELSMQKFDSAAVKGLGLGAGTFGLFSSVVKNGYLASVFALLSPILIVNASRVVAKISAFIVVVFLCFVVFSTQQRSPIIITVLFFFLYILKIRRSYVLWLLGVFSVPVVWYLIGRFSLSSENLGRIADISDNNRFALYVAGLQFIKHNFFFGGREAFAEQASVIGVDATSPHNLIINAFVYGGVLGAICIFALYFRMLLTCCRNMAFSILGKCGWRRLLLGAALSGYSLNSLTHNASIVTGEAIIWVLYVLLIKTIWFEQRCVPIPSMTPFVTHKKVRS